MFARLLLLINLLLFAVPVDAGELRYYLIDFTVGTVVQDIRDLIEDKPRSLMGNTLSVVINDGSTQALIKIPDANSDVRAYMEANFTIVQVYTKHDHREVFETLDTDPNWSNIR